MLRIHWAIVLLAVIGTISITWYLRTKNMDFLNPSGVDPSEDKENTNIATGGASVQPDIPEAPEPYPILPEDPPEPAEPEVTPITEADLGDLETAPGLDAYRDFAREHPADRLFQLSSALRSRGYFQRALLAFERVVDTAEPDSESLVEASLGIAALTLTLPRWNVDPETEIQLTLTLSIACPAPEFLKKNLLDLALTLRESSGDQLEIIPKILSKGDANAPTDGPVALWLSPSDDEEVTSSVITARLSNDPELAYPTLALAVFKAIRSSLVRAGYPRAIDLDLEGPNLLKTQITRLMWRDFALTLDPSPARRLIETEDLNEIPEDNN